MVDADEIMARVKAAEAELARAKADARAAADAIVEESRKAHDRIGSAATSRDELAKSLPPEVLAMYEQLLARRGTAVVQARDGHCSICHVRLRPKVYQDVRRNDAIIHCDSCQRILYYVPSTASAPPAAPPTGA
jgi:predicted  nucleic acid-binding Zn-ribbon protein